MENLTNKYLKLFRSVFFPLSGINVFKNRVGPVPGADCPV